MTTTTLTATFDYLALPEADRQLVQEAAERIKPRLARTREDSIEIGRLLLEVKQRLGHGQFGKWLAAEFGMSSRTARRFMRQATAEQNGHVANLKNAGPAQHPQHNAETLLAAAVNRVAKRLSDDERRWLPEVLRRLARQIERDDMPGIMPTRLAEKYRPQTLADVVGQPCIRKLQGFANAPYATCWLLQGPPGVGKTATARALAAELGAVDECSGLELICTANMGKADAEAAVRRLHLSCLAGEWNVLLLEELERLSPQCQVFLKVALASENLPPRAVVIATSNDTSLIDPALLERFGAPLTFDGGARLAEAGAERLAEVWAAETAGGPLPKNADRFGWHLDERDERQRYSLRSGLDALQQELLEVSA